MTRPIARKYSELTRSDLAWLRIEAALCDAYPQVKLTPPTAAQILAGYDAWRGRAAR